MKTLNSVYSVAPALHRALVAARPFICPFGPIISQIPQEQNVLDVGCGVGSLLVTLALQGNIKSGIGCDINPKSIEVANRVAKSIPESGITFRIARTLDEIPQVEFDVITLIDVMHHVDSEAQRDFFTACADRVRLGGLLVYKDMADKPLWKNIFNRLHDAVLARQFIHYAPLESVEIWAKECNMSSIYKSCYSRFAYAHELIVLKKGVD